MPIFNVQDYGREVFVKNQVCVTGFRTGFQAIVAKPLIVTESPDAKARIDLLREMKKTGRRILSRWPHS